MGLIHKEHSNGRSTKWNTGANLAWANLAWANLAGADLTGAKLTGAKLTGAKLTEPPTRFRIVPVKEGRGGS